jgi:hypothetical protein
MEADEIKLERACLSEFTAGIRLLTQLRGNDFCLEYRFRRTICRPPTFLSPQHTCLTS